MLHGTGEDGTPEVHGRDTWWGRLRPTDRNRARYGWVAAILFFAVAVVSLWRLPSLELRWTWLGAASVLLGLSVLLLAAEYRLSGWLLGHEIPWGEALRTTILSSAANLLPVPGGVFIRTEALRTKGSGWAPALGSNLVVGLGWLGVALLLAGALLHGEAAVEVVMGFAACGVVVVAGMGVAIWRIIDDRGLFVAATSVLLLEGVYVTLVGARLYAILVGIGLPVSFGQAVALAVASALAAAVGFFPGGMGLRELLAGALSPLVGLAPAVGAFSGVVDRVISVVVRGLLAGWLWCGREDSGE